MLKVDFVENLWESRWESWWESRGKNMRGWWKSEFCTKWWESFHVNVDGCGKFYRGFYTWFYPCKMPSFTSFAHSLQLLLLII